MNPLQDVFISYGRADSYQFAKTLNERLLAKGLNVWFDFDDIPLGVDYQKQIDDGIDKADNFLFIISPHSVNSPYCGLEVQRALQRGKRIIPLLQVEEISHDTWKQRNPNGTDEQWADYQAAGK
ncbi:MAG: toll/interleukin-1 receptor domain-containing protein, partial [Merismopedia sp. SIO2A8]|nr:toll/interleukin-1 receptor domain-containing protein [Merismopedia sp. SIO2A8]